jgi:hypothetical protein
VRAARQRPHLEAAPTGTDASVISASSMLVRILDWWKPLLQAVRNRVFRVRR